VTQTNTPTQSFTPSVTQTNTPTITQTITPTSLCRCTTITNLESSANTISYYFCGFAQGEPILIEDTLEANQEIRICVTNDSVVGENILVSYDGGTCQQVDNTRVCPELPTSPTPTMTPTITQTVTPSSPVNQNIIIVSGTKNFPGETTQQGLFKYDYDLNTMTYLDISGLYAGVSHSYSFQTQTGIILEGKCVTHEIDVKAKKDQLLYLMECKYKNQGGVSVDVKVPLYINSRFEDVLDNRSQLGHFSKFQG
jgi:hypothetical protein